MRPSFSPIQLALICLIIVVYLSHGLPIADGAKTKEGLGVRGKGKPAKARARRQRQKGSQETPARRNTSLNIDVGGGADGVADGGGGGGTGVGDNRGLGTGSSSIRNINSGERIIANEAGLVFAKKVYEVEVDENKPVGTTVLNISATHIENESNSKNIRYEIKKRKTDADAPPFRINAATGVIQTLKALDYETNNEYIVYGYARIGRDKRLKATTRIVVTVLNVDDVPLRFTLPSYEAYVDENTVGPVNNSVVLAEGDSERSFILTGSTPTYGLYVFGIDSTTGRVSVVSPLDREENGRFVLVVEARSRAKSAVTRLIVHVNDLNDNPPVFPHHVMTYQIYENANCWLPLNATDRDAGENAVIRYRLLWGGSRFFLIEPDTGLIRNTRRIDYEQHKIFRMVVNAYSGNLFGYTKVVIRVIDANDNPPILNDFQVFYNALPESLSGAEVARVPVRDVDSMGELRYGMVPERNRWNRLVFVDEMTGVIRLSAKRSQQVKSKIVTDITVYVTDGVHGAEASCRLELTPVSIEMMVNGVSVNILNVTEDNFLRSERLHALRNALAHTLNSRLNKLVIFNLQEVVRDGYPLLNVSFSARDHNNQFFSREYILSTIYFERKRIEEMSGLPILPAEDDVCILETCNNLQRCVPKKSPTQISSVLAHSLGDLVTFRGVHLAIEQSCECPDIYSINNCSEVVNFCESQPCSNGGTCEATDGGYTCICPGKFAGDVCQIDFTRGHCFDAACKHGGSCVDLPEGGFMCDCKLGYDGPQCEMTSRFFPAGSYMTFPTLHQRSMMRISLNFSTELKNGLLLYVSRYSQVNDLLAIEIIDTQIAFSFAVGKMTMRVMVGTTGGVSDFKWHVVELVYKDKMVEVMLDSCDRDDDGEVTSNFPCVAYATQALDVTTWFLDVNTPLLVGSIPTNQEDARIITRDFIGCINNVRIDKKVLDFADSLSDFGTEPGCPYMQ